MISKINKITYHELRQDKYDECRMIRQYRTKRKFKITYFDIKFWLSTPRLFRPFYGTYKQFDEWFKFIKNC